MIINLSKHTDRKRSVINMGTVGERASESKKKQNYVSWSNIKHVQIHQKSLWWKSRWMIFVCRSTRPRPSSLIIEVPNQIFFPWLRFSFLFLSLSLDRVRLLRQWEKVLGKGRFPFSFLFSFTSIRIIRIFFNQIKQIKKFFFSWISYPSFLASSRWSEKEPQSVRFLWWS